MATEPVRRGASPALIWFRPSIRRAVWRLWRWAFLSVLLGAVCLGALVVAGIEFDSGRNRWLAYALYAIGIGLVTAGPLRLLLGVQRVARVERVLSVHEDGLRWQDGDAIALMPWSRIEEIAIEDDAVVLATDRQRIVLPALMEGIETAALAAMLSDMRKKALLGVPVRLAIAADRT